MSTTLVNSDSIDTYFKREWFLRYVAESREQFLLVPKPQFEVCIGKINKCHRLVKSALEDIGIENQACLVDSINVLAQI